MRIEIIPAFVCGFITFGSAFLQNNSVILVANIISGVVCIGFTSYYMFVESEGTQKDGKAKL